MRILVAQMTRMGDVLQTSPLIRGLRRRHPDAYIALMVRRMGRPIAERNPDVNEVIVYDEDTMFVNLRAKDSDKLLRAYEQADAIVQDLSARRFDIAYNCTNSICSAMLLKLARIPQVIGAHLSDDWRFVLRGPWTNYFFTSIFHREYNDLNLCDIFAHFLQDAPGAGRLIFETREEDRRFVASLLAEHGVDEGDFIACFQLGASEGSKRWAEGHFAALGRMLAERYGAKIFLIGVEGEACLGAALVQQTPGIAVPLYGKTSIPQLAALLERSNILVTNDTGTMHLAAAVGCPLVLVSVGYVHFRETGPYGEGLCAIERRRQTLGQSGWVPGGLQERMDILPEQVLKAVEFALASRGRKPLAQVNDGPQYSGVGFYTSRIAPDGFLEWYPVVRRPMTRTDFLRTTYRAMWLEFLDAQMDPTIEQDSLRALLRHYVGTTGGDVEAWRDALASDFSCLAELAARGIGETEVLLDVLTSRKDLQVAKEIAARLHRLDEEVRIFGEIHGPCKPLVVISRYERENLEGADAVILAQTTLAIYHDLQARARLMQAKVERVAGLWAASG